MPHEPLALVPRPTSVRQEEGAYVLPPDLGVAGTRAWAAVVRRLLAPGTGLDLPLCEDGALRLVRDPGLSEEAYRLRVTADGITLTAATEQGLNWAVQTLRQLLPPSVLLPAPTGEPLSVPFVVVEDAPRFGWRGVMLDVARHFFALPDLFRVVDLLALHKHNVLHLHLTEDQGWRFPVPGLPRLQEVGSWRAETRRPHDDEGDGTPHGGSYTADQLRALVAYAGQRGITVVPEIDLPGHALALLAAYPELGNDPGAGYRPATTFGVFDEVLNLSDETLRRVLEVYTALLEVFPSPYVHVGGDECPRTEWLASPAAQALAAERGLADVTHLQRWFTEQLRDWLAERGRRLVGWDEICDEGPLEGAVAMAWRGAEHGVAAAAAGMRVVMAPATHTYLDFYPGAGSEEPYAIGGLTTTETVYGFEPLAGMTPESAAQVLGTQCQLWTEYVPGMRRAEYQLFPRACAHSEVAWSAPADRSWPEFAARLDVHLGRLDALGVCFRPEAGPHPWQQGGSGRLRRPLDHAVGDPSR
jgi:hexosaminidase